MWMCTLCGSRYTAVRISVAFVMKQNAHEEVRSQSLHPMTDKMLEGVGECAIKNTVLISIQPLKGVFGDAVGNAAQSQHAASTIPPAPRQRLSVVQSTLVWFMALAKARIHDEIAALSWSAGNSASRLRVVSITCSPCHAQCAIIHCPCICAASLYAVCSTKPYTHLVVFVSSSMACNVWASIT
jgi:hypothetical protein